CATKYSRFAIGYAPWSKARLLGRWIKLYVRSWTRCFLTSSTTAWNPPLSTKTGSAAPRICNIGWTRSISTVLNGVSGDLGFTKSYAAKLLVGRTLTSSIPLRGADINVTDSTGRSVSKFCVSGMGSTTLERIYVVEVDEQDLAERQVQGWKETRARRAI